MNTVKALYDAGFFTELDFRFTESFSGMEVIEKKGTLIGWDGSTEVRTPYDDCVLVMPSRRLRKGASALRFGRYTS